LSAAASFTAPALANRAEGQIASTTARYGAGAQAIEEQTQQIAQLENGA